MAAASTHLLDELAATKAYIVAARDIVKDGFMPDMSALEKRISDICVGIQAAEVGEQSRCLPELASLLKCLDDCERDMRAWENAQKNSGAL